MTRVLLDPGATAWVEEPGYWLVHHVLASAGRKTVPVPLDSEGLNVAAGIKLNSYAKATFVAPSHQYPLGVTMSATRRFQLLEWANKRGSWIIEDDYDSECNNMAESQQGAPIVWKPVRRIQWFTIIWMAAEVTIALIAAIRSRSVAVAAFGGDSAIELLSAAAVLWRFHSTEVQAEKIARKVTGWLLIALAVYIALISLYTLIAAEAKPQPSYVGIALLVAAAVVMPWLARRKRKLAGTASSPSLRADAAQSSVCGYIAWIALVGLLLNAFGHFSWADPIAALGLIPILIWEAKEAFER